MATTKDKAAENQTMYIASVVAAYWVVSISMVYLNKVLLSSPDSSIPAPLFVTWFQCVITALICYVLGFVGDHTRREGKGSYFDEYPMIKFDVATTLSVMPLSVIFVGMITFNNVCLQLVEVSFYNVARSLTIVFNVIFSFLLLGKTTSTWTGMTLLVVMVGFYVGVDGEVNFSFYGTLAGVIASVFVSMNSIYTAKILPLVNNDKSLLLFYNNVNGAVLFVPLIAYFEGGVSAEHLCYCRVQLCTNIICLFV
jgi:solute carrier family 35 (GDP-fucose transporter), member C1